MRARSVTLNLLYEVPLYLLLIVDLIFLFSVGESVEDLKCRLHPENSTEISLWERLGKAAMLNIESSSFSWDRLSSLHHTEHSSSNEQSEDEMNKALEV